MIDKEIFPTQWKISRVCHIPKTGNLTSIEDYRPISVLSVLSKVYKQAILNQLCSFIETQSLYNININRKVHSTSTLLLKLPDDIRTAMNRSEVILPILRDCSRAFHTIDHHPLLEKLQNMKFAKNNIKIICSYLIERYQYVQIEDKRLTLLPMFFGVPQGSILGPVLFNL